MSNKTFVAVEMLPVDHLKNSNAKHIFGHLSESTMQRGFPLLRPLVSILSLLRLDITSLRLRSLPGLILRFPTVILGPLNDWLQLLRLFLRPVLLDVAH